MQEENKKEDYFKGRGAQINTHNPYLKKTYVKEHHEVIDEPLLSNQKTKLYYENPKKIVNLVKSPDIPGMYSMNPYQGCEHGCIYCYARNSHEYWGFSAGLDFERKIIVKQNAPEVLEKQLSSPKWIPSPIMFSGNTDCYQPAERQLKITRKILEVLLKYKHPVSMITKNSLITRDIDILKELAKDNLVHVMISITTLKEDVRLKMEPRTATAKNRLNTVSFLASNGIPVGVMVAPIIPGLNSSEVPAIIEQAAYHGAKTVGYTMVRLNGSIAAIFTDWVIKNFPDSSEKILHQIAEVHGGQLEDKRWGKRMRGDGNIAESINQLFKISVKKFGLNSTRLELNTNSFVRKSKQNSQLDLF